MRNTLQWFTGLKPHLVAAVPYLVAFAVPGGSVLALALWLFRGRHREA